MRLRHYWKLLVVVIAVCVAIALAFGTSMVRPYITSQLVSETVIVNDIEGTTDLFDDGEHTIEITFNQDEYEEMLATFREEDEKEYIRADITIDGTLIENVGLRLKGNSTLQSLSGNSMGPGGNADQPDATEETNATEATEEAQGGPGGGGMGGGMTQLSEDSPEELPWLISFDEYEEGRAYQGKTEIALRPAASGFEVAINEALALEMTEESGQVTQDYSFTTVTVNGSESASRLVVDTPDSIWADNLGEGVLYKARADGSLSYIGDDPTEYEESFNQINGEGAYDLQPVMTLLDFLNNSTDEEFAAELDDYVDTESFAKYLATQEILSNNDAMDGPGNNYYLWYDTTEEQFTVLSWDLNMALSGMMGGMGGGMPTTTEDNSAEEMPAMPEGVEMPQDGTMPQDGQMPEMPQGQAGPGEEGGGGRGSSLLKERFLENEEFYALYEQAYAELYQQLIASGYAEETLDAIAARAEEAGDTGASSVAETIRTSLASLSEEAPEPSSGMGMGGGGRGGLGATATEDAAGEATEETAAAATAEATAATEEV